MAVMKKTISIDETVAQEAMVLGSNFSAVVETALVEYIQHHRVQKAIQAFGKWGERDETSAKMVRSLRLKDDRDGLIKG